MMVWIQLIVFTDLGTLSVMDKNCKEIRWHRNSRDNKKDFGLVRNCYLSRADILQLGVACEAS